MNHIKVSQTAEKWWLSPRLVRLLCSQNRIDGVVQNGKLYIIPENAPNSENRRNRTVFGNIEIKGEIYA